MEIKAWHGARYPALDSTTEQSVPTGSSPLASGRAPYSKGSLDLGHQRNVDFVSSTLQTANDARQHGSFSTWAGTGQPTI